jgi:hypothetical protein
MPPLPCDDRTLVLHITDIARKCLGATAHRTCVLQTKSQSDAYRVKSRVEAAWMSLNMLGLGTELWTGSAIRKNTMHYQLFS